MRVSISDPQLQRFIKKQVKHRYFSSRAEVVAAGLARLMLEEEPPELDEETLRAIAISEQQIARGQCREFKEVARELRAKYLPPDRRG